jgi:hypothetical protein
MYSKWGNIGGLMTAIQKNNPNILLIYPEIPDTFRTLFKRPTAVPLAVTLSIYGYHFRRVCELRVVDSM